MNKTLEQNLYKTETIPLVGNKPDRIRPGTAIYEFGTVNETFTLHAASDKIALAALIPLCHNRPAVVFRPKTCIELPTTSDMGIANIEVFTNVFKTEAEHAVFTFIFSKEICEALRSVIAGTMEEREYYNTMVTELSADTWNMHKIMKMKDGAFDYRNFSGFVAKSIEKFVENAPRDFASQIQNMRDRYAAMKYDTDLNQ